MASRQLAFSTIIVVFGLFALFSLIYGLSSSTLLVSKGSDHNDMYNVRLLPVSLSDEELDRLPPTAFSYLAMIDAGSSGCRVHVYRYGKLGNLDGPLYLLPKHISMKVKPGLSSFATNPTSAGKSLAPLVTFLKENVPEEVWGVTPIWLKATAGLRMLSSVQSDAILEDVRNFLLDAANSPFLFRPSYARIIPGKEEGAFGWVAFNYLKRIVGPKKISSDSVHPYAVVEMGGASSQVTQRVPLELSSAKTNVRGGTSEASRSTNAIKTNNIPLENHYSFHIEEELFELYTYSYLGYGSEQAREKLNTALLKAATAATASA